MKRRQFIQASASSLLLPVILSTARGDGLTAAAPPRLTSRFFVDHRFETARRHASDRAASLRIDAVAVQGDVTSFWVGGMDALAGRQTLELHGMTTESFRFCLEVLLRERSTVTAQVSRLDSNLLHWHMHSSPLDIGESFHG